MKTTASLVAVALCAGFAATTAQAGKLVPKGRAGYAYAHVHRSAKAPAPAKAAQRQTTVALDVGEKKMKHTVRMRGRNATGWRIIRR
ncbi:MAG: hypothetical protein HKN82_05170 [Akkermansiaceae bacterium]|nr:hypothetical protein [Akkermansiaceae bacterium]